MPVTETEVAFALLHVIVVEPGAVAVLGDALMDAATEVAAVTVTIVDCVTGPPLPCAMIVNVWVPTARPLTDCEPLADVLLRLGPVTATDVALALDHVIIVESGAVVLEGDALIDAATLAGAATVTVWLMVAAVAPAASTALAVNVMVAGPVSEVLLPESPSVPLPPPANANPTPFFQMLT